MSFSPSPVCMTLSGFMSQYTRPSAVQVAKAGRIAEHVGHRPVDGERVDAPAVGGLPLLQDRLEADWPPTYSMTM